MHFFVILNQKEAAFRSLLKLLHFCKFCFRLLFIGIQLCYSAVCINEGDACGVFDKLIEIRQLVGQTEICDIDIGIATVFSVDHIDPRVLCIIIAVVAVEKYDFFAMSRHREDSGTHFCGAGVQGATEHSFE